MFNEKFECQCATPARYGLSPNLQQTKPWFDPGPQPQNPGRVKEPRAAKTILGRPPRSEEFRLVSFLSIPLHYALGLPLSALVAPPEVTTDVQAPGKESVQRAALNDGPVAMLHAILPARVSPGKISPVQQETEPAEGGVSPPNALRRDKSPESLGNLANHPMKKVKTLIQ